MDNFSLRGLCERPLIIRQVITYLMQSCSFTSIELKLRVIRAYYTVKPRWQRSHLLVRRRTVSTRVDPQQTLGRHHNFMVYQTKISFKPWLYASIKLSNISHIDRRLIKSIWTPALAEIRILHVQRMTAGPEVWRIVTNLLLKYILKLITKCLMGRACANRNIFSYLHMQNDSRWLRPLCICPLWPVEKKMFWPNQMKRSKMCVYIFLPPQLSKFPRFGRPEWEIWAALVHEQGHFGQNQFCVLFFEKCIVHLYFIFSVFYHLVQIYSAHACLPVHKYNETGIA